MRKSYENASFWQKTGWPVLWGVAVGGVLCILLLLLMAAVMTGIDVPQSAITPLALTAGAAGALVGGAVSGWLGKTRGWLSGLLTGAVLFVIIALAGSVFSLTTGWSHQLLKAAILLIGGMAGGVVGVNLRRH
ncbi:MAG: TIGR04086 family membrane protein [Clostridia bacterium]|nr:TIGR04086 family membrane protein [Clostridia bacterium]